MTSFLRMLGTVLGWVLLLLLLLYCEAAIVVAYGTAAEMDSRIRLEMGRRHYEMGEKSRGSDGITKTGWYGHPTLAGSKNISVISGCLTNQR